MMLSYLTLALLFSVLLTQEEPQYASVNPDGSAKAEKPLVPHRTCLHDLNLVSQTVSHDTITDNHNKSCLTDNPMRYYPSDSVTLGFITPWNKLGYKFTLDYAYKFTHISPVWFEMKQFGTRYLIMGENDINKKWLEEIKKKNENIKIIPRIHFSSENWRSENVEVMISKKSKRKKISSEMVNYLISHQFDGAVLVMSPYHITLLNSKTILDYSSGIPLMTYDYNLHLLKGPGPNAPLMWLKQLSQALDNILKQDPKNKEKILLGLNYYGYQFAEENQQPRTITGKILRDEVLDNENGRTQWEWQFDQVNEEHYMFNVSLKGKYKTEEEMKENYNGYGVIQYPTLYSIEKRIRLAKQFGFGLSLWEIGQGLEYFNQLL